MDLRHQFQKKNIYGNNRLWWNSKMWYISTERNTYNKCNASWKIRTLSKIYNKDIYVSAVGLDEIELAEGVKYQKKIREKKLKKKKLRKKENLK